MTLQHYRNALSSLDLRGSDEKTQAYLGLSRRQLIRIYNGHSPVPGPVTRLLGMYQRFGLN